MEPVRLVLDERDERGPGELAVIDTMEVVQHEQSVATPGHVEIVRQHTDGVHESGLYRCP